MLTHIDPSDDAKKEGSKNLIKKQLGEYSNWRSQNPNASKDEENEFWYMMRIKYNKDDPELDDLFDGKKFMAPRLADILILQDTFRTVDGEVYRYNGETGIYEKGEDYIKGRVVKILGDKSTEYRVKEVLSNLKVKTYAKNSEPPINIVPFNNCLLDLNDMKLIPFSPDHFFTWKVPANYNPDATCPRIKDFLSEVVDPTDIGVLQEFVGYCLYRKYKHHRALLLVGDGGNGKSTFLNLTTSFLGSENTISISLQDLGNRPFALHNLRGKLANIHGDIPPYAVHNTGPFKLLTGGDNLTADRKFKDRITFTNHAKLIFSCNKVPPTGDDTNAFYRRWIIINFPNNFPPEKEDTKLLEKLATPEELSGMLNWALEGLRRLIENGKFSYNKSAEEVCKQYDRLSDPVKAFVMDYIEYDVLSEVPKKIMYNWYIGYCSRQKLPSQASNVFSRLLPQHVSGISESHPTIDGKRIRCWRGVRLRIGSEITVGDKHGESDEEGFVVQDVQPVLDSF